MNRRDILAGYACGGFVTRKDFPLVGERLPDPSPVSQKLAALLPPPDGSSITVVINVRAASDFRRTSRQIAQGFIAVARARR